MIETLNNEVEAKVKEILESNNAIMLATTGADYSPWILGAYFVSKGLDIYLLVEKGGKSFANIKQNKNAAYSISQNDATKDFIQGKAVIEVLPEKEEANVREMLLKKMPWYQTFVPMVPIKIISSKIFVTSLQNGWFPAKVLENMN
ncbi:MAG: pyridoxamine 5'-phosphate oxidase family protein [Ignavibacteria bacterium]|nr:pyridoxamine 5'-phosphate oxidase family protein [Ignavibacteria bacterium]